jgi:hypothetical protein
MTPEQKSAMHASDSQQSARIAREAALRADAVASQIVEFAEEVNELSKAIRDARAETIAWARRAGRWTILAEFAAVVSVAGIVVGHFW